MTRKEGSEVRSLNRALRDGDPAAVDARLTDAERHRIRARLSNLKPVPPLSGAHRWLISAVAVSIIGAIAFAVSGKWTASRSNFRAAAMPAPSAVPPVGTERHELRQLRFVTSGGTQVIWLLDPRPKQ